MKTVFLKAANIVISGSIVAANIWELGGSLPRWADVLLTVALVALVALLAWNIVGMILLWNKLPRQDEERQGWVQVILATLITFVPYGLLCLVVWGMSGSLDLGIFSAMFWMMGWIVYMVIHYGVTTAAIIWQHRTLVGLPAP